ncbi:MAG: thioredoxin domain-containing protein [Kofleriaceae bacterium]|nr:thioredoxin domain-containing protein [Myxococcales bacterium]MCB9560911.1 thioredoxin domain-containing protein [Kofleriaceae bacterium]
MLGICALFLTAGASCKKEPKAAADDPAGVIKAADAAKGGSGAATAGPVDTTPIPGVDVSKLDDKQQALFYKLVGSFSSPCGKAHSLRTSVTTDTSCKRAPFAARYLASLIDDELPEDDVRELWEVKYKKEAVTHDFLLTSTVPHAGPEDAPIKMVEFFDYGCPACQGFKPVMDQVIRENPNTLVVYYKMFPLVDKHPDSMSAAKAALAAAKQGKFLEMHDLLFERAPKHKRADVLQYAEELGLDVDQFQADYDAAETQIRADMKEGDDAGVQGTPTIFFDGRQYEGPAHPKYFRYWIDEDLAVNR